MKAVKDDPAKPQLNRTPLLGEGGVDAPTKKMREASLSGADGVVRSSHRSSVVEPTAPSAPSKVASHQFLGVASTPPLPRRGVLLAPKTILRAAFVFGVLSLCSVLAHAHDIPADIT